MNNNPLISVVVPVYRVEADLAACVESVLAADCRLELILVDDGSPDACGTICDAYAAADSRVHAIHQPNAGVCAARNAGLNAAKGTYIAFVDGDDTVAPDFLSFLLDLIQTAGADIAQCGNLLVCPDETKTAPPRVSCVLSGNDMLRALITGKHGVSSGCCNKLYRRELFQTIRFDARFAAGEDLWCNYHLFRLANKLAVDTAPLYRYRMRAASATHTVSASSFHTLAVLDEIAADCPNLQTDCTLRRLNAALTLYHRTLLAKACKDRRPALRRTLRADTRALRKSGTKYPYRTALTLLRICPPLYDLLYCLVYRTSR